MDGYFTDGYQMTQYLGNLSITGSVVCATCGHSSSKHAPFGKRKCNILGSPCVCAQFVPSS